MAQGLILYNGALLLVNGGLTVDPNCCCDIPPPPEPCPPCCVRIDFGTFDSDGNLFGEFAEAGHTIEVLITMPTKFSRIICDEQQIAVRWSYFDGEGNPADADGGFVRFGNGWIGGAGSPAIAGDGIFLVRGLIDWGVSASATFYEAGFTFRECFMDSSFFLYYLDIGLTSPEWSETIEISRCPSPELCCPESVECADCCALLVQNDAVRFDAKYIFYDESFDAGGGRKTMIIETQLNDGRVCIGEAFTINVYLIPARHDPLNAGSRLTCNHPTWNRNQFSPAIGVDGVIAAESIQWGLLTILEYEIVLKALDCDDSEDCGSLPLVMFSDIVFSSDQFGSVSLSFTPCDLANCCPCTICDEGFDNPCCFGQCAPMTNKCTRITEYEYVSYESSDDTPVNRFIQTVEAPNEDSGIYLGGCEFRMVYRFSVWDSMVGDWGEESIVTDPDGFRYRNDGWYDGNAINAPLAGPCCGLVEGVYGPTNSGNPADFYDQRYAEVSFRVVNPCDPCEEESP